MLKKELMTTAPSVNMETDSLRQAHYREATGSTLNVLQIIHQPWQVAEAYIDVDESEMRDLLKLASKLCIIFPSLAYKFCLTPVW